MAERRRLIDLKPAEQRVMADLMLPHLTDAFVRTWESRHDHRFLEVSRESVLALEAAMHASGQIPTWTPDDPIPDTFMRVRPHDDGRPRPPLVEADPDFPRLFAYQEPALGRFRDLSELGGDLAQLELAWGRKVGGSAGEYADFPATLIAYCWRAWTIGVAEQLAEDRSNPANYPDAFFGLEARRDGDGRVYLFAGNQRVSFTRQTEPNAETWTPFRWVADIASPFTLSYQDDFRLAVFGIKPADPPDPRTLVYAAQETDDGWGWIQDLGGKNAGSAVGATRETGGMAVFTASTDQRELFTIYQEADRTRWSDWQRIGGAGLSSNADLIVAGANPAITVCGVGSDGRVWYYRQPEPHTPFDEPHPIDYSPEPAARPRITQLALATFLGDGSPLVLYVATEDGAVYFSWQHEDRSWRPLARVWPEAAPKAVQVCLVSFPHGGGVLALVRDTTGVVHQRWCRHPAVWEAWKPIAGASGYKTITAEGDENGLIQLFGVVEAVGPSQLWTAHTEDPTNPDIWSTPVRLV